MVGPLGVVVSPFRPTSRKRGGDHATTMRRRDVGADSSCSACEHQLQDLTHLLLHCPASEPLWRAIFVTTSSIFDFWSRPWSGPTAGSPWNSSTPPSLGRGRVAPPPPPHSNHNVLTIIQGKNSINLLIYEYQATGNTACNATIGPHLPWRF